MTNKIELEIVQYKKESFFYLPSNVFVSNNLNFTYVNFNIRHDDKN